MSENMVNLTPEYIGIVSALVLNSQKNAMEQAKQYQVIQITFVRWNQLQRILF